MRILIAGGSDDDAEFVAREIEQAGHALSLDRAETAEAFAAALANGPWDAVIADSGLPQLSVTQSLLALGRARLDIPFIVLSRPGGEEVAAAALQAGANDYVIKGDLTRLVPAIERELAEARVRRARGRAEEALHDREAYVVAVLDHVDEGVVAFDEAGRIRSFNPAAERIFGHTAAEVLGTEVEALIPEGPRDALGKGPWLIAGRRKDGTPFSMEIAFSDMDLAGRRFTLATVRDVTERRRAEEALEELRRRKELILAAAGEGIIGYDPLGRVTMANPAAARMLGRQAALLPGWPLHDLVHVPESGAAQHAPEACPLHVVLDDESVIGATNELVWRKDGSSVPVEDEVFWRKEGESFPVEYVTTPIREDGKRAGAVLVFKDISERKAHTAALEHQAMHDGLTGLPNRTLLHDRVQQAIRGGLRERKPQALLLLDLDHFKDVNDTLGHHAGDLVLREMRPRLRAVLRASDTFARLGGDEFAVLLPGTDLDGAAVVAAKMLEALRRPFTIEGLALTLGASIGGASFPDHGNDADALLRRADVAMYTAKHRGGGFARYALEQDQYSPGRLALMDDLRAAIEAGQLELHYQPQIEIATRRVVAAEALVRWPRARSGNVPPDQFIPLAEVTGLVQPLTTWVLATALRRCRLWQDAGLALTVSVNLSPRSLQDAQLAGEVGSMLREFGVPPSSLVLEITESGIVADPERALEIAGALGRMGVRLAIDDFGTGYTSLAFLTRLPVDEIKIDKSFVIGMTSPEDAVIVRSTIDLGHDLGLRVVAEGVETAEALEALAALRCDRAQGLHIGRPMAADDFESWLRESPMGRGTARPLDTPGATP